MLKNGFLVVPSGPKLKQSFQTKKEIYNWISDLWFPDLSSNTFTIEQESVFLYQRFGIPSKSMEIIEIWKSLLQYTFKSKWCKSELILELHIEILKHDLQYWSPVKCVISQFLKSGFVRFPKSSQNMGWLLRSHFCSISTCYNVFTMGIQFKTGIYISRFILLNYFWTLF